MTLDEIDIALEDWRSKLAFATDNLLALDDVFTYKRLEGKGGMPPAKLTGTTAAQVTPALGVMHKLFEYIALLTEAIDRARELRKAIVGRRPPESALREIEQVLQGPSIQLPAVQVPLEERGLLSASATAETIAPKRLLLAMLQSFDAAKDVIFAVDVAWNRLEPALNASEIEASELQRMAEALGEAALPDLVDVLRKIASQRALVQSDPLGVTLNLERDISPLLRQVRARLQELTQQKQQVQIDLEEAHALLQQLRDLHPQCVAALTECREKIADPSGLKAPLDPARVEELGQWLPTLEDAWSEGRWKPARIGLERWKKTAGEYLSVERAALAANRAPLEARAELRGRLSSLKVKAQARGLAEEPTLAALAQKAEQRLQQRPTPLEPAARSVAEYEAALRALTPGR